METEDFIKSALLKHGNKFDYSLCDVSNAKKIKVEIICRTHGIFLQTPSSHLQGTGCSECFDDSLRMGLATFIERSKELHGDKYYYDEIKEYVNSGIKVNIGCHIHGIFWQTPESHLNKFGCRKCSNIALTLTTEEFIRRSIEAHGDRYDYSKSDYINSYTNIEIGCSSHGYFWQRPRTHFQTKCNCPECSYKVSKPEKQWLASLGIPEDKGHRQVRLTLFNDRFVKVDGYDPETKTVYEFWGDYWHGNPEKYHADDYNPTKHMTYGELYQKTNEKIFNIKNSGYKLVEIWESDWSN